MKTISPAVSEVVRTFRRNGNNELAVKEITSRVLNNSNSVKSKTPGNTVSMICTTNRNLFARMEKGVYRLNKNFIRSIEAGNVRLTTSS